MPWIPRPFTLPPALLTLVAVLTAVTPPAEPEDELRAAAVLSFLRYSTWPAISGETLTVGVVGRPTFAWALTRTLEGKSIGGRSAQVVVLAPGADLRGCQLVYLAMTRQDEIRQTLSAASEGHVLTIGETDRFLELGGAVQLFIADGHIGFETSIDAVARSGVSISSSLLRLGRVRNRRKAVRVP